MANTTIIYSDSNTVITNPLDILLNGGIDTTVITGNAPNEYSNNSSGGAGSNVIYGGGGNDRLYGQGSDDAILGQSGNDTLFGNAGNDALNGGSGNDYLYGGAGTNTYLFNSGDGVDTIITERNKFMGVNEGIDTVVFGPGITKEDLSVQYGMDNTLVIGIKGTSDKLLIQNQQLFNYYYKQVGHFNFDNGEILTLREMLNLVRYDGTAGNDLLNAGQGNDKIYGYKGNDIIYGNAGNDLIVAGTNDDSIIGGDGGDMIFAGPGTDTIEGGAGSNVYYYNVGDGVDTIITERNKFRGVNEGIDSIVFGAGITKDNISVTTRNGVDLVVMIDGTTDALIVQNQQLFNSYYKQVGSFTFADGSTMSLREMLNLSKVYAYSVPVNYINGSPNDDVIFGSVANDSIVAGAGNDYINGLIGDDTMLGGAGNDTYIVDSKRDVVTENANEGNDLVKASVTFYLGANVENLFLIGKDDINGYGNNQNNVITGNDGENYLFGGVGNDVIFGGAGNDTVDGGLGTNVLAGGDGDDEIKYTSTDKWGIGNSIANSGSDQNAGTDQVISIEGKVKNTNVFDGGAGYDKLILTNANNALLLDDQASVTMQTGARIIDIEEIVAGSGSDVIDLTSQVWSVGDILINGGAGNDIIWSSSGNDTLIGGAGNDVLFGGFGNDILEGGSGNDTYQFVIGDGDDIITDASGTDKLKFYGPVFQDGVAFFKNGNNLDIELYDGSRVTVNNQFTASGKLERFELSDGSFISESDLNNIVQFIASYADDRGIIIDSVSDVKNNYELMTVIAQTWH